MSGLDEARERREAQHEERFARLPKWAQAEIQRLEANVAYYQKQLLTGPEDSDTFAEPYSDAPRPLGKGPTIEFVLDDRVVPTRVRVRVDTDRDGRRYLDINGGDSLVIHPWAANVVKIRAERLG